MTGEHELSAIHRPTTKVIQRDITIDGDLLDLLMATPKNTAMLPPSRMAIGVLPMPMPKHRFNRTDKFSNEKAQ
jgi:hypothetical protein